MDLSDNSRRAAVSEINSAPKTREELAASFGDVWDTQELSAAFSVLGFHAPYVSVVRVSDGVSGMLTFQHSPRYYWGFSPTSSAPEKVSSAEELTLEEAEGKLVARLVADELTSFAISAMKRTDYPAVARTIKKHVLMLSGLHDVAEEIGEGTEEVDDLASRFLGLFSILLTGLRSKWPSDQLYLLEAPRESEVEELLAEEKTWMTEILLRAHAYAVGNPVA